MKKKHLVIVESPTKEKTISKILGKDYVVKSSFGHIRDLPAKELGVDEKRSFTPTYVTIAKAKKNISGLKTYAKKADILYLATDHDREGESIAWHLAQVIKMPKEKVRRIVFNEITPTAVLASIENASDIDLNLVTAQQARRILDRLVGYKLSPLLWKKIAKGLSAGRVQSVAVRLLVERAKEIENFKSENYWSIRAKLEKPQNTPQFEARLFKWENNSIEKTTSYQLFAEKYTVKTTTFKTEDSIKEVCDYIEKNPIVVSKAEKKELRQKPRPPFITSSLQQEAYIKLGFSSSRTMRTAQSLYEGVSVDKGELSGLITYMRTDSYNISDDIKKQSRKFISEVYGDNFASKVYYAAKKKVKGAQQAHEAIHPTDVYKTPDKIKQFLGADELKLYNLIWIRFLASQMADAVFDGLTVDIAVGTQNKCVLRANGRALKFAGFLKVYEDTNTKQETVLPDLKEKDELNLIELMPKPHKTQSPPIYNEASLIKTLEAHGIGRPSTYAPIIKTIVDRQYANREKAGRLTATDLGTTVTEKLKDFFPDIMELSYTAEIEQRLDKIAEGSLKWVKVVQDFYTPFTDFLANAYKKMKAPEPKVTDEKCPVCDNKMLLRESRFGKYLSCSKFPKCKGKIPLDKDGKKIVPQKTDKTCPTCGKPMVVKSGRRGKFLACSDYPKCKTTCSIVAENCFAPVKTGKRTSI
jgi:DNA topoisomerase-1